MSNRRPARSSLLASLDAARRGVAVRTELVRITGNLVEAKTANESALKNTQTPFTESKAQFFDAQMQCAIAQAILKQQLSNRKSPVQFVSYEGCPLSNASTSPDTKKPSGDALSSTFA
jgi:outer membrane protein TolC